MIQLSSRVRRKEGIIAADMNGEAVMMSIESGKYYNIGEIGGRIWSLMEEPVFAEGIISTLLEEYKVSYEQCRKETLDFLEKLLAEGMISLSK